MSGISLFDPVSSVNWVDHNNILFQELNQAIELNSEDRVNRLLRQVDSSIALRNQLETFLNSAITQRKANALKALLEHPKIDPNTAINGKKTLLVLAVELNYPDIVNILIENKADLNLQDDNGWSALDLAANFGFIEILRMLVESPDCKTDKHHSIPAAALHFHYTTIDIIETLLQHNADPNALINSSDGINSYQSALHSLCECEIEDDELYTSPLEAIELILENEKTDPNIPDKNGLTLLHKIAQNEIDVNEELINSLFNSNKLLIDAMTPDCETALYFAAINSNKPFALELYNRGASPHTARETYKKLQQDQLDDAVFDLLNSLSGRTTKNAAN